MNRFRRAAIERERRRESRACICRVFLAPTHLTIVTWPGLSRCKLLPSRWCGDRARQVHHARAFPAHSKNPTRCPLEPHSPSLPCGTSAFDWRTLGRQPLAFAQPQCRSRQCRSMSAADVFSNLTVSRRLATAISQYVDRIREIDEFHQTHDQPSFQVCVSWRR